MSESKRNANWRWWLAGWLRRIASAVMRERWYVADTWHGVPGNRFAELRQQIWVECVTSSIRDEPETLERIGHSLDELAQAAGESWGHIWPKDKTDSTPAERKALGL